jgi:hypothetical protein
VREKRSLEILQRKDFKEGMRAVAQAYNLSYSAGGDQKDHGSRPAWVKGHEPSPHLKQWLSAVVCTCHPQLYG